MADIDDVHSNHCCDRHGCKYGDPDCPVAAGILTPLYRCEDCPRQRYTVTPRTPSAPPGKAGVIVDGKLIALVATPELAERIARALESLDVVEQCDQGGVFGED